MCMPTGLHLSALSDDCSPAHDCVCLPRLPRSGVGGLRGSGLIHSADTHPISAGKDFHKI